jgi:hypothetical protein
MSASLIHSSYNQAPNRMALTPGTRLGPYAVTAPLGLDDRRAPHIKLMLPGEAVDHCTDWRATPGRFTGGASLGGIGANVHPPLSGIGTVCS